MIYPLSYLLHIGLMLTISKVLTILCLLCLCGNRECQGSFPNKSVSCSLKLVPKYILLLPKLKGEGRSFWSEQAWNKNLVVMRDEKVCPFVKFELILLLLCCLLYSLTNKDCRAWSFMINLWIESKTCQNYRILLSAR